MIVEIHTERSFGILRWYAVNQTKYGIQACEVEPTGVPAVRRQVIRKSRWLTLKAIPEDTFVEMGEIVDA